jgi:hypothetical protein
MQDQSLFALGVKGFARHCRHRSPPRKPDCGFSTMSADEMPLHAAVACETGRIMAFLVLKFMGGRGSR